MPPARRHIAILAPPTAGHLNPLQVLGRALSTLGHRVSLVHVEGVERFVAEPSVGFHAIPGTSAPMLDAYLDRVLGA